MPVIRVIDLETTGFEPPEAAICEAAFCDIGSSGTDLAGAPVGWDVLGGEGHLVNPGKPIPPETSAIHHIIDEDVAHEQPWDAVRYEICAPFGWNGHGDEPIVAFAAHNAKFERQWITEEVAGGRPVLCTYKAALRLWRDAPAHSNQALRYWRRPAGLDRGVADRAHRAFPDAYVTAFLLRDMLNDGATVEQLIQWSTEPALQVRCHIGKWRGTPWKDVDYGFLEWVSQRDFDEDVLFTVRTEMERRDAAQEEEMQEA